MRYTRALSSRSVTLLLTSLLLVGALLATAGLAQAAPKGDRGGGKPSNDAVTLSVNPDPARAYVDEYDVSGCGLQPSELTDIVIRMPQSHLFFSVETDAAGCLDFSTLAGRTGEYRIDAYQVLKGKKASLVGTGTLTVVDG